MVPDRGDMVQLAYVVEDMDAALNYWTDTMGAGPFYRMTVEVPDGMFRGTRCDTRYEAAFGYHGDMNIELLAQANGAPSVYREMLDTTGPGFHHFMIKTDDYDEKIARYADAGSHIAFEAQLPGSGRWAYLDARSQIGSYIEIYEMQPHIADMWDKMKTAHQNWDGSNPVRTMDDLV